MDFFPSPRPAWSPHSSSPVVSLIRTFLVITRLALWAYLCGARGLLVEFLARLRGITALQFATYSGHVLGVRALLENSADPAARNELGETALDWAKVEFGAVPELLSAEFEGRGGKAAG